MKLSLTVTLFGACVSVIYADMYMHSPRGSNNRLNEGTAQRSNQNRLFDSQNNNRGGYNVGDLKDTPAKTVEEQYPMNYVTSDGTGESIMPIEWTNQHGCGANDDENKNKLNCNIVIQMMCQTHKDGEGDFDEMRDGIKTDINAYPKTAKNYEETQTFKKTIGKNNGLHERYDWYDKCNNRKRNSDLFTADQKLKGDSSKYTRQNPEGNRHGYECPEERDYYPYWHPTPWIDIMVLTEREGRCAFYEKESFNVRPKHECVEANRENGPSKHNNETDCVAAGDTWTEFHNYLEIMDLDETECNKNTKFIWARPIFQSDKKCLVQLTSPECKVAPFSRVNHLGNGVDLEPLSIQWKIPAFPSRTTKTCVLRIRYNISTDDYDPGKTNSEFNGEENSPVTQNPRLDIGAIGQATRLAINTQQFGRTFQDRTHIFRLKNGRNIFEQGSDHKLYTVQVRGKRGNIVQTFPAVEYDFFPTKLTMREKDMVLFTWTGSNTHHNGGNGGDGDSGDDGEGRKGTDRSNVCGILRRDTNFPLPANHSGNICQNIKKVVWSAYGVEGIEYPILPLETEDTIDVNASLDACIQLMSAGYYKCHSDHMDGCKTHSLLSKDVTMQNQLDNAPASFKGIILQLKKGTYHYTCSRNNNFTNRSQKATITVTE